MLPLQVGGSSGSASGPGHAAGSQGAANSAGSGSACSQGAVDPADPKRPVNPSDFPQRIGYTTDSSGVDHYRVTYPKAVLCRDGVYRRQVYYYCRSRKTEVGSRDHIRGQTIALKRAWAHCELPTTKAPSKHGRGPLQGDGLVQFHGSSQNDHCFRVHPTGRHATARGITVWRPDVDTILEAKAFCTNHRYVRMLPNGATVYQCLGHDVSPTDQPTTPGIADPNQGGEPQAAQPHGGHRS